MKGEGPHLRRAEHFYNRELPVQSYMR